MKHFSLRARLTAAFLLIYLVPVLALGIPGSLWIAHSARDAASRLLETRLENASERMEAMFSSMDSYANQMQGDALVRGLMYMQDRSQLFTRYSAAEYANFAYQLKLALVTTDMFDDVALCFPGKNFCLTQRGSYDLDMLIENEFAVAGMDEAGWQALWGPDYSPASLLPDITMETFGQQRAGMLYLRVAPPPYGETPLFAMIYFISDAGVRRCLQPLADYGTLTLTLALPQGDTPLVQGAAAGGARVSLAAPVGGIGGSLALSIDARELYASADSLRGMLFALLALMACLGSGVAVLVATVNYRPLAGIFSALFRQGTLDAPHPTTGDLKSVEQSLLEIMEKEDELRRSVEAQQDLLRYAALARLLDGTLDGSAREKLFATLAMPLPHPYYSVGILFPPDPQALACLIGACHDLRVTAYPIEHEGRSLLLLNHDAPAGLRALAGPPGFCLALSDACGALSDVPNAYAHALHALNYRSMQPQEDGILFYADVSKRDASYYYPLEAEVRLVNMLRAGDAAAAESEMDALLASNLEQHPSAMAMERFLSNLEMTLARECRESGVAFAPLPPDSPLDVWSGHLRRTARACAAAQTAQRDEQGEAVLADILSYLDEHLSDSQLSLGGVAAHFGMNASSLSRFIKKKTGVGYLDIINRRRIELAKEYLRQDTLSIRQLAASVGFDSDVTLRRLFKKYEGITPTQYKGS
ncbi:helix-turn-helix domain-containing protein [Beduinella massiliensis]|uniref:helix-turn-helix domain-containing protein n=1 Tax=Beduinella massiliensis TaxID=1852363 RepID=UPI000C85FE01